MDSGQAALLFFYGIFWSIALGVATRYRAFDTASLFGREKGRAWSRFVLGISIMNGLPLLWIYLLYGWLEGSGAGAGSIIAGILTGFTAFGWHRIFHAITSLRWNTFYSQKEWSEVNQYAEEPVTSFWPHFFPGFLYVTCPVILAYLARRFL